MCLPALDQVFELLQTIGRTGTHLMDTDVSELDEDKPGKFIDLKKVLLIWTDQEDVAIGISNIIPLDVMYTGSPPDIDKLIMIVFMQRMWPRRRLKIIDYYRLKLFIAFHSGKIQKAISYIPME
jgi:hypothetical protein